ncbi:hypothetical protein FBY03_11045 [Pseudomonas sp. SJZ079]|uniref:hypothetical protein n=1 Tax=Pseudomonas sp. SJZ079 TaxID=2572887 RepID=UPI00119C1314|nr:hypothetical protein [Pseudomonas sp. SJZ079]TWC35626.1 hypothetical protein FBY03_11045 [Pseudomonas sp. SJZ079]
MTDHGGVDQVEQALTEHAADDRQAEAEDLFEALTLDHAGSLLAKKKSGGHSSAPERSAS